MYLAALSRDIPKEHTWRYLFVANSPVLIDIPHRSLHRLSGIEPIADPPRLQSLYPNIPGAICRVGARQVLVPLGPGVRLK